MVAGTELQGDSSVRQDRQNHPQKGRALLCNERGRVDDAICGNLIQLKSIVRTLNKRNSV